MPRIFTLALSAAWLLGIGGAPAEAPSVRSFLGAQLVSPPLALVALTPCRVVDTRGNGAPIQGGAFVADETRIWAISGNCGVPIGAGAVSLNITVTATGAHPFGFLEAWPSTESEPNVSTINWSGANQTIANAAVVPLGAGSIKVKTGNAGAQVIVDVNGYYGNGGLITSIVAGSGLTGGGTSGAVVLGLSAGGVGTAQLADGAVTDAKVAAGISYNKLSGVPPSLPPSGLAGGSLTGSYPSPGLAPGSVGLSHINTAGAAPGQALTYTGTTVAWQRPGSFTRTVIVSPIGTPVQNGSALLTALASITDASATNPYLLKIEPGVYDLGTTPLAMKEHVDVEGSGELTTTIQGGHTVNIPDSLSATVIGANKCELRFISVQALSFVPMDIAMLNDGASPLVTNATLSVTAYGGAVGIYNTNGAAPTLRNVKVISFLGTNSQGIWNAPGAGPLAMQDVRIEVPGGDSRSFGFYNTSTAVSILDRVQIRARGGVTWGIAGGGSQIIRDSVIDVRTGPGQPSYGLAAAGQGTTTILRSQIMASTASLVSGGSQIFVADTLLDGPIIGPESVVCAGVYNAAFTFFANSCP